MDTYDFDSSHTSPVLEGYSDGGWIRENGKNQSGELLEQLLNDEWAITLKADKRYSKLTARLKEVASLS